MRPSTLVAAGVAVNLALAGAVAVLVLTGDEGKPPDAVQWLGDLALVAVWALPAVVALLARNRFVFLLAAAVLALLVVPTTHSVSLLFVAPAVLYLLGAVRTHDRPRWMGAVVGLAVVATGAAAGVTLLAATEGRCFEYEVRADGTTVSRTVPTEGRWERRDGTIGGSSRPQTLGEGVVEAGGGCEDRTTAGGAILALVLAAAAAGIPAVARPPHAG
jgi:hypothetical protein